MNGLATSRAKKPSSTLQDFIRSTGMTQVEMSDKMKVDKAYLNQVINGKKEVTAYFMWHFWYAFVRQESPFFLPTANNSLCKITHHMYSDQQG